MFSKFARPKWRWGVLALALVAALVFAAMALTGDNDGAEAAQQVQFHGAIIQKQCITPKAIGQTTDCLIRISYNDDFGDTIRISEGFDSVQSGGGPVRVPGAGNLPISAVSGNTTCTVSGSLPCNIGEAGSTLDGLPGTAANGQVTFRSNQYVIQSGDPDPLPDQGTARVQDLCDDPNTSGCSTLVNTIQFTASTDVTHPSITVTKECTDATGPGQPIDFSGTVRNDGDVTLNNVTVADDHAGTVLTIASLAPGASANYSGSYVPSTSPSTDTVTATGTDALGTAVSDTASATCKISTAPCMEVTKVADPTTSKAGDSVDYTIRVCNCGDVTLEKTSVNDSLLGDLSGSYGDTLAGDACESHEFPRTVLSTDPDPLVNTVTAKYEDSVSAQTLTDTASATVDLVHPDFEIAKECSPDPVNVGDTITWGVTLTNTGDVALHIALNDPTAGIDETVTLAAGATQTVTRSRTVTDADGPAISNTVAAVATLDAALGLPNVIERSATSSCQTGTGTPSPTATPSPTPPPSPTVIVTPVAAPQTLTPQPTSTPAPAKTPVALPSTGGGPLGPSAASVLWAVLLVGGAAALLGIGALALRASKPRGG